MISVVVLTKNNDSSVGKCLESVLWCDEIIVIDDFSDDNTVEIARSFTSRIYKKKLNDNFSEQRNFGLLKVNEDWVLFIDSDEIKCPKQD